MKTSLEEMLARIPGAPTPRWPEGDRWAEGMRRGTMSFGVYAPRGRDPQQPHTQDEIYVIHAGTGTLVVDGERQAFRPGDVLFVAAGATHRFEEFSGDFAAWVVFWGREGGEGDARPEPKRPILGLRTVIYPVTDLAEAKRWYGEVFEATPTFDAPFYVGFTVGGFELGLVPDGTPGVDGAQVLWGVEDVQVAEARLCALGATALEPVTDVGGGIRVAAVKDPFGNRLGLVENPHFDRDAVR